ncbi:MAG: VWA domain-containing protein [Cyanobacteriota bacterium]
MKEIAKGQKILISNEITSNKLFVCFNWDDSNARGYDIDLSIIMLSTTGKLENEDNFIFYNNPSTPNQSVKIHSSSFDGYKKASEVNLDKIANDITRIMFLITIDNGDTNNQRFENVKNLKASLCNENKTSVIEYKIEGLTKETAIIAVEIYKHNNEWKYQSTGSGFNAGLDAILAQYGSDAIQVQEPTSTSVTTSNSTTSSMPVAYNSNTQVTSSSTTGFKVVFALDISFSMTMMLRNGTIQTFTEKLLDFSKRNNCTEIDFFPFHDEAFHHPNKISQSNINKFISKEVVSKYFLGECYYEPIMKMIASKYSTAGKGSQPVLVVFLTDGDCGDKNKAEMMIRELSSKGIFWQFVAVGEKKSEFTFLTNLDNMSGRTVDNADFTHVEDLKKLDHDTFERNMMNEFPSWLREAKSKGICN